MHQSSPSNSKITQNFCGWGCVPDPTKGVHHAAPKTPSWTKWDMCVSVSEQPNASGEILSETVRKFVSNYG